MRVCNEGAGAVLAGQPLMLQRAPRAARFAGCAAWIAGGIMVSLTASTQTPPPKRPPEVLARMSVAAETQGLAEPFKGVTTNGTVEAGLFSIKATGVSTAQVRRAAEQFLAGLTQAQRDKTLFAVDDPEWRKWMNQSFYVRQGVEFLEMTPAQRELAFALLRASLSAKGVKQTRDIMRLNETLAELTGDNFDEYGEWRYNITIMGKPSATEPWGWQFDGHHAIINYFVLGDQVVMTPLFAGSEPVVATSGKYKGTAILQEEQDRGLSLINGLSEAQRHKAILSASKTSDGNLTEAWRDNVVLDYAGIPASELTAQQRQQLLGLISLYVDNMDDGHARARMQEIQTHLDRTRLAWIGASTPGSVFYYRIHSPVILIEFDHQRPVGLRHLLDPTQPNRAHVHTVVRTPNGNDYGKDLLRQHYELQAHPAQ
jgi:hypothetical protein